MPLAELQASFFKRILGDASATPAILSTPRLAADERLQIYANAYRIRLLGALREDSPMLHQWLGDEAFDAMALDYVAAHPSSVRNLRWYGEALPNWLLTAPRWSSYPLLAELAEWERSLRQVFDGADSPVLTREQLATLPPEAWPELYLQAIPALTVHRQRFNTVPIWQALKTEQDPPHQADVAPLTWLIWRRDLQTQFRSLSEEETALMARLINGVAFAEVCEHLAESHGGDAARAAAWLGRWLEDGVLRLSET